MTELEIYFGGLFILFFILFPITILILLARLSRIYVRIGETIDRMIDNLK